MLYLIVSILNWILFFIHFEITSEILFYYIYYISAIPPIGIIIYSAIQSKKKKLSGIVILSIIIDLFYLLFYWMFISFGV